LRWQGRAVSGPRMVGPFEPEGPTSGVGHRRTGEGHAWLSVGLLVRTGQLCWRRLWCSVLRVARSQGW